MNEDELSEPFAICSSIEKAKNLAKEYREKVGETSFEVIEFDIDKGYLDPNFYDFRTHKKI